MGHLRSSLMMLILVTQCLVWPAWGQASILGRLGDIDRAMAELERQRIATVAKLEIAQERAQRLKAQSEEARARVASLQGRVTKQFKRQVVSEREGVWVAVLASRSLKDYVVRQVIDAKITQRDLATLREHQDSLRIYKEQQARAEQAQNEASELLDDIQDKAQLLHNAKSERGAFVARIAKDKAYARRAAGEVKDSHKELSALVRGLAQKADETRKASDVSGLKGALMWPTRGHAFRKFGESSASGLGVESEGLHIRARVGEPVKSAFAGKAVYAGWMRGFGQVVIVDHGRGVHSLYAHLDRSDVQNGDVVKAGQTIGSVGETESIEGPQLYFELRHDGLPINPSQWFRRR